MRSRSRLRPSGWLACCASCALVLWHHEGRSAPLFVAGDQCLACHNGLTTASGRDVSFGYSWRPSMMANSARDPYWQASVRRETIDHPKAGAAIEDECAACHMPMARYGARATGKRGVIFSHLPAAARGTQAALLARDGVSCAACHQIAPRTLGSRRSFNGGFFIDTARPAGQRRIYGPYVVERGLDRVMRSAAGFRPHGSVHVQRSEICASCHTLFTHALTPDGKEAGTLPEQVPYLEWKHSAFRTERACQSCHMPLVESKVAISSVLGEPRTGFSRHVFRGGNFFIPRLLNRYRAALGVRALPLELQATSRRAVAHLASKAARLRVVRLRCDDGSTLDVQLEVTNLAGHKLPTAYPSRRAWLHLTARDAAGRVLFESGAVAADGSIHGNDNDADGGGFEPHHSVVDHPDKVQIYEAIMVDRAGQVTTGLLRGVRFIKDNRLLPRGFDKHTASADVAVRGRAAADGDFFAASDLVRYRVPLSAAPPASQVTIEAELLYQPLGHRWATNLADYAAAEPRRFVRYYRAMADSSTVVLARTSASWQTPGSQPANP